MSSVDLLATTNKIYSYLAELNDILTIDYIMESSNGSNTDLRGHIFILENIINYLDINCKNTIKGYYINDVYKFKNILLNINNLLIIVKSDDTVFNCDIFYIKELIDILIKSDYIEKSNNEDCIDNRKHFSINNIILYIYDNTLIVLNIIGIYVFNKLSRFIRKI